MIPSVDVSVEVLRECMVREIAMDGQEIYDLPLTMSENLALMAHKIDFFKIENGDSAQVTSVMADDDESDQETEHQPIIQPPLWPWESVRTKLRTTLMEMSVLCDLLLVTTVKKYVMMHHIEEEIPDTKNGLIIVAKKRTMARASSILNKYLNDMREYVGMKDKSQDFHYELLKLRKNFKLKISGTRIFGDFSYKSSGSKYHRSGMFEVLHEDESENEESNMHYTVGSTPSPMTSYLSVIIPEEFLGQAYIRIFVREVTEKELNFETFFAQNFSSSDFPTKQVDNLSWHKKLEMAQQVIYCKETFDKLCLEGREIKSKVTSISCGNQLICHIFPNTNLFVTFVHHRINSPRNRKTPGKALDILFGNEPSDRVLEHCMYQLLRESYLRNSITPMPHPVSSRLHRFKSEHLISPGGYSLSQINAFVKSFRSDTILESLIKVSRLQVMRQRIVDMLDDTARKVHEPQILIFTASYFCTFKAVFKVSICFSGFDSARTSFTIFITHDTIEVASREVYVRISQGIDELKDFVLKQAAENHIAALLLITRQFNWRIVATHSDVIMVQKDGRLDSGTGIIIISPNNNREISVCCSKSGHQRVMLLRMTREGHPSQNSCFGNTRTVTMDKFELINMRRVPGLHFAKKMENLVAILTYEGIGKS